MGGPHPSFGFATCLDSGGKPLERLVAMLQGVKMWLEAAHTDQVLDALLAGRPYPRALFDATDRVDHIGFLLPNWAKPMISEAATEAGFPLGHRAFPSSLVARELGRISGRRRLETQIFKAYGRTATGEVAFEAFIPATDDAQVEAWIRGGVCNHVAIVMSAAERFKLLFGALASSGVSMSGFMYGNAVYLVDEDATIMYFDVDDREHPFRLEVRTQGDHAASGT